ncbi:MAG: hypothetical protein OC190_13335 [Novosphingobium aromaticivorans]|nr:hypothetical protein [Novosphingobium aromaticivorans]
MGSELVMSLCTKLGKSQPWVDKAERHRASAIEKTRKNKRAPALPEPFRRPGKAQSLGWDMAHRDENFHYFPDPEFWP